MLRTTYPHVPWWHCVTKGHRPYQIALGVVTLAFLLFIVATSPTRLGGRCQQSAWLRQRNTNVVIPEGHMHAMCPPCVCDAQAANETPAAAAAVAKVDVAADPPTPTTTTTPTWNHAVPSFPNALTIADSPHTYNFAPSVLDGSYHPYVRAAYPPVGPEKGTLLHPSYLKTPIAYGTHFVPTQPHDGFPVGHPDRPACQRATDILQSYIYANQHPGDCQTKRLLVRRDIPTYGLFAGLGLSSNYLFLAATLGRTLVDLSRNSYFKGNCATNNGDCVFLPQTSCTQKDFAEIDICFDEECFETARVISLDRVRFTDFLPCAPTEYPRERCNRDGGPRITMSLQERLPELGQHGEHFYQTEFSRYLTRPNDLLQAYAAYQMELLGLSDRLISVHVRHGDKNEGVQFPTRAYAHVVRRAIQVTGIKTVFLGSDDVSVFAELPEWVGLPGVTYRHIDPNHTPTVHSAWEAKHKGENTIGITLLAQMIIYMQSAVYIGTRSSMAGQIVYAMQANDCTRPKLAYDMGGDLFYNSWYCRNDMEHAGREFMCALTQPAKGMILEWGGAKTDCRLVWGQ